jgi:DNA topoisomerase-1
MMVAQRLYESGYITYMRTDSVNLSSLCIGSCKDVVAGMYGMEYHKSRNYATRAKGAQEAHEAIRPTYMSNDTIEGTIPEKRLYELIWKRTCASQMADALVEKTTVNIAISGHSESFVATGEVTVFDGFMKVYRESTDDETQGEQSAIPAVHKGDVLTTKEIVATATAKSIMEFWVWGEKIVFAAIFLFMMVVPGHILNNKYNSKNDGVCSKS